MKWNDVRRKTVYVTRGAFDYMPVSGWHAPENYKPTWTLDDEDHDGVYSLRKWYLKFYQDPTEVEFVKTCFEGDFKHWDVFKNSKDIGTYYRQYKKDAEAMLLADAMKKIVEIAMDTSNKSSMSALKYLADRGSRLLEGPKERGGRPKKEDIRQAARDIVKEDSDLLNDLKRISE